MITGPILYTIADAIALQVGLLAEAETDTMSPNPGAPGAPIYPLSAYLHNALVGAPNHEAEEDLIGPLDIIDTTNYLTNYLSTRFSGIVSALSSDVQRYYTDINDALFTFTINVHRNFAYLWGLTGGVAVAARNVYIGTNNWPAVVAPNLRRIAQGDYDDVAAINAHLVGGITCGLGRLLVTGPPAETFTDGARLGTGASSTAAYAEYVATNNPQANYDNAPLRVRSVLRAGAWTITVTGKNAVGTVIVQAGIAVPVTGGFVALPTAMVDVTAMASTAGAALNDECVVEVNPALTPVIDQ